MTVCVATFDSDGNIVAACDQMISMQGLQTAETAAVKIRYLGVNWVAMFAATDASPITPIIKRANNLLFSGDAKPAMMNVAVDALCTAYSDELQAHIQRSILNRYSLTVADLHTLKADLAITGEVMEAVRKANFDVSFLVMGHDKDGPHIFTVDNPGVSACHDVAGYHAVGTGAWLASSELMRTNFDADNPDELGATVYNVCGAKFAAEAAEGVGGPTFLLVIRPNELPRLYYDEPLQKIKDLWYAKRRRLAISTKQRDSIRALLIKPSAGEEWKPTS
jgi:hypothetical protein